MWRALSSHHWYAYIYIPKQMYRVFGAGGGNIILGCCFFGNVCEWNETVNWVSVKCGIVVILVWGCVSLVMVTQYPIIILYTEHSIFFIHNKFHHTPPFGIPKLYIEAVNKCQHNVSHALVCHFGEIDINCECHHFCSHECDLLLLKCSCILCHHHHNRPLSSSTTTLILYPTKYWIS